MVKKVKAITSPNLNQKFTPKLLGEVVRAKRTQSKVTQQDAALLSGVSKQTYIKIEQGNSDVKLSSLMKVISALGIKISIMPWQESDDDVWV